MAAFLDLGPEPLLGSSSPQLQTRFPGWGSCTLLLPFSSGVTVKIPLYGESHSVSASLLGFLFATHLLLVVPLLTSTPSASVSGLFPAMTLTNTGHHCNIGDCV